MISIDNSIQIKHCGMGLFETFSDWIHPEVIVQTYELIYCISGDLKIYENDKKYIIHPGEMLFLEPNMPHGGYEITKGHTAFHWLHFSISDDTYLKIPKISRNIYNGEKIFKEIMHCHLTNKVLSELALAKFLLEISTDDICKNKIIYTIDEFIRINSSASISVAQISNKFNYSPDYISRLFKKEFGETLKERIIRHRLSNIEAALLNTNHSIKQIAYETGFQSENDFVKFFKYNTDTTPTKFRNKFYRIHMNNH